MNPRALFTLWMALLCAPLELAPSAHAAGPAPAPEVRKDGFCLRKVELRCLEVVLTAGAPLEFERLPILPDGKRGIYFFSDQVASSKATFVHVVEALDEDPELHIDRSDAALAQEPGLDAKLKALGAKLANTGSVVLTPFRGQGSGTENFRSFSSVPIEGPGEFSGRVVDLTGAPVPGGEVKTISVMISGGAKPP